MDSTNFTDVVILAGGFGERLWPASRPDYPKQFISLEGGLSFMQTSILRAIAVKPAGKILIITRKDLLASVAEQVHSLKLTLNQEDADKISEDLYILAEPCARHTCAPLLLACKFLKLTSKTQKNNILVLASDHVISPADRFVSDCEKAAKVSLDGNFVCFAIAPTEPSTGYGYIKSGAPLENQDGVFKIDMFKEKPDLETAKSYLASGNYWWNSGMFGFTASFFEEEINRFEPKIADSFKSFDKAVLPPEKTLNSVKYVSEWKPMEEAYATVKAIAVDNAIAERTERAVAVRATFNWDDVGSWDAFERLFSENVGKTVQIASENNFIYSDLPVALCGVDDLVVVIKNGNALVMKKGSSGMMREVVKQIKEKI